MSTRTIAKSLGGGGNLAVGTYTGDGAATQAITGVGFQPRHVIVYRQTNVSSSPGWKITNDLLVCLLYNQAAPGYAWTVNGIISLDADGFTVGNAIANILNTLGAVYTYIAFG